jgi:hypothetical protein
MTPALSARARTLSFGQAVIRIVGMLLGRADTWRCRSRPLIPGILISVTRQAVRLRSEDRKNSLPWIYTYRAALWRVLAGVEDHEFLVWWRIVAAISGVRDDARERE